MNVDIDEARALLDAYGELYHHVWYSEDGAGIVQANAMRDALASAIAGTGPDGGALDAIMGDVMGELGELGVR